MIYLANMVDNIIKTQDGQCLTIEEWLDAVPSMSSKNYVLFLNILFPRILPALKSRGFTLKQRLRDSKMGEPRYSISTYKNRITRLKISINNSVHEFIEFGGLIQYRNPYDPILLPGDIEFADWLLQHYTTVPNSPVEEGRKLLGRLDLVRQPAWKTFPAALKMDLKMACLDPAIMYVHENGYGHHDCVWDYDFNSLYPYVLATQEFLPDAAQAKWHDHLPTRVPQGYVCICQSLNRISEMFLVNDEIPCECGWLIPLSFKNPWRNNIHEAYKKKKILKQKGGPEYRFYKLQMNSFIGTFAQRGAGNRIEVFIFITTIARRMLLREIITAEKKGCHVLAANTDGWITDKPIPGFCDSDELGKPRLDAVLHNATIYEYNRIVSDEGITLAGLPADCYDNETQSGTFHRLAVSKYDELPRYVSVTIDVTERYSEEK